MAQLTPQQIAQLAYNAGFRGQALNVAVQIALAESGGRTDAYNPETAAGTASGSGSRGLWQIYGTAHPEYNNSQAFDPQVNANAAFKVFMEAGKRFSPWSTYNAGLATPAQDYARMIKGATQTKTSARKIGSAGSSQQPQKGSGGVKTVAAGVSGWQDLINLPSASSVIAPKPAPAQGPDDSISLPFGIEINKSDLAFVFFGSGFLFFGVLFLLLAGTVAAAKSDLGKEAIGLVASRGLSKAL